MMKIDQLQKLIFEHFELSIGTHSLRLSCRKKFTSWTNEKKKNNLMIIMSTSSDHEQNICNISKRYCNNCQSICTHKVPHSLYPRYNWQKMTKFTSWKKKKIKMITNLNHMHTFRPWTKNLICSFKKIWIKTVRSCTHKVPIHNIVMAWSALAYMQQG